MKFAIFGGDARFLPLPGLLEAAGHSVSTYALGAGGGFRRAAEGAECLILPLPCESGGRLNAPFCAEPRPVAELLEPFGPGIPVCAGKAGPALRELCRVRGLPLYDYFEREDFTLKNAELTAEGALKLMLEAPIALRGSRVLILGFGRIGRLLAAKLTALGAHVSVAARSAEQRALAEVTGCRAVTLDGIAGDLDFAVNTIPETLFGAGALESMGGARLIELASPPYGFDRAAAASLGREIILGSGLPGKTAPQSAARVIADTILNIMDEIR